MKEVSNLIIGAGLSGLGAASNLQNHLIVEKESSGFGHASSYHVDGYYYDRGAHICHSKDENWLELIKSDDLSEVHEGKILNYADGVFFNYPVQNNLYQLDAETRVSALASFDARRREGPIANYHDWCVSQYGEFITENFYRKYTDKYWRTPMEEMATDWLGGRLLPVNIERIYRGCFGAGENQAVFSKFRYPKRGGFQGFFEHLSKGINVVFNKEIQSLNCKSNIATLTDGTTIKYEKIINTSPLKDIVKRSGDFKSMLPLVDKLRYLNLVQSIVYVDRQAVDYDSLPHWFYVYDTNKDFCRVMVMNKISNDSKDAPIRLQVETFRRDDEEICLDSISKSVLNGVSSIFECDADLVQIRDIRNLGYSYVVPVTGTSEVVTEIISELEKYDIQSIGLFGRWKYIWSDAAYYNYLNHGE